MEKSELKNVIPKEFLKNLEELLEDPYAYQKKKTFSSGPFHTYCHGDFLRNNIAFKYEEPVST